MPTQIKIDPVTITDNGSIEGQVVFSSEPMELRTFMERMMYYDLEPIFQRGDVWTPEMKANLILSILTGMPIGPVTVCENKNNVAYKSVIDAKQRSIALRAWWNGDFSIPFVFSDKVTYLSWKDILLSNDPKLTHARHAFEQYKVTVVTYKHMSLPRQAKQFGVINTFVALENEELLYGKNYWAKGVYKYVFQKCLRDLLEAHCKNKDERENKHEKGTILAHRICYTCFGGTFEDVWQIRNLGNTKTNRGTKRVDPMVRDAEKLNSYIGEILDKTEATRIEDDLIKSLPFYSKIDDLARVCKAVQEVLEFNGPTNKKFKKNDLFDIIIFLMERLQNKTVTIAQIKAEKKDFFDLITTYQEIKDNDKLLNNQTVQRRSIDLRKKKFDSVYDKHIKDAGVKGKKIPDRAINIALLKAGPTCPVTGEVLHNGNVQIDHIDPKSKRSETGYCAISASGNLRKSNSTLEEIGDLKRYMEAVKHEECLV